jgi:heme oxygenase
MEWRGPVQLTVRGALRAATSRMHERLHDMKPFRDIAEQRLSRGCYTDLLGKIAALHLGLGETLGMEPERRELLFQDLDALRAAPPSAIAWSTPETSAARLGCLYVVEGSALGGKVIYRQLDYLFGSSDEGRSFFRGSAADVGRWHTLCRRIEEEGCEESSLGSMISGAQAAFSLFERVLAPAHAHG